MLATVPSIGVLARAMGFFQGNVSKEVGRLHRWRGALWASRYHLSIVTEDGGSQVQRLEYVVAQGCKEGLVWRPGDWPGVHSIHALLKGVPLVGTWVSRRSQWTSRNRVGDDASDLAHSQEVSLDLEPLPCWAHLPESEWRRRLQEIVGRIEVETRTRHAAQGTLPLGLRQVRRTHPHHCPKKVSWSPQPAVLSRNPRRRKLLQRAIASITLAYRGASRRLTSGDRNVRFPKGTFPPGLPYVPTAADLLAGG